jgi:hypothetical protein
MIKKIDGIKNNLNDFWLYLKYLKLNNKFKGGKKEISTNAK